LVKEACLIYDLFSRTGWLGTVEVNGSQREQRFCLSYMITRSEDYRFPIQIVLEIKQPQREAYHSHLLYGHVDKKWSIM
jgi:hypothetical protein